jgi:hypothetical protein
VESGLMANPFSMPRSAALGAQTSPPPSPQTTNSMDASGHRPLVPACKRLVTRSPVYNPSIRPSATPSHSHTLHTFHAGARAATSPQNSHK